MSGSKNDKFHQKLNGVKLTWLGHGTFRFETPEGKTVIVDPWIMGNPMCPESEKKVKKVDVVLCTHGISTTLVTQSRSSKNTIR